MPIQELTEATPATLQLKAYNEAGSMNKTADTFELDPGQAWAIMGTTLLGAVVVGDIPTLKAAIEALDEVTLAVPLIFGLTEDTILTEGRENAVLVSNQVSYTKTTGTGTFSKTENYSATIRPGAGIKYAVWGLTLPAELDAASLATLKSAITGITGVSGTVLFMEDRVHPRCVGVATVRPAAHNRLDPVPEA